MKMPFSLGNTPSNVGTSICHVIFFAGVVFILEVKSPDAILQSEVPLDSTNLGSVSVSPLGLASGVAWPTRNNQVCVCTDGMNR